MTTPDPAAGDLFTIAPINGPVDLSDTAASMRIADYDQEPSVEVIRLTPSGTMTVDLVAAARMAGAIPPDAVIVTRDSLSRALREHTHRTNGLLRIRTDHLMDSLFRSGVDDCADAIIAALRDPQP